ncbi:acyltransferase [Candidatus Gottesmanbacteria bacterium]|nr:acyltransferase [Candidatus Gottesmanbacteria bacterium]
MNKTADPLLTLRGVACLAIIWFHLRPSTWLTIYGINVSFLTAPSGTLSVYIFYLLSGYTIGYGFFSKKYTLILKSLKSFYINRFLRIAPAYYVSITLCILIFYPRVNITAYDIFRFFTFTANIDYITLPYQHLLAIISTQMQFYLVAPFFFMILNLILKKIHPAIVGILILSIGALTRHLLVSAGLVTDLTTYMLNIYVTVWGMIDYFLFGMLLSFIVLKRPTDILNIKKYIPNGIFYTILMGWLLWINYGNFFALPWQTYALYHLFIIPLTLCLLVGWYILSCRIQIPILSHIGKLSYGMYLYHFILFDILYRVPNRIIDTMPAFLNRFIIIFTLTWLIAFASFHFIERPFLRLRRYFE